MDHVYGRRAHAIWEKITVSPSEHETRFNEFLTAVPTTLERSHIEGTVNRYMSTYPTGDVETRLALFTETLRFQDPVGHCLGTNKAELRAFFESTNDTGASIRFFPERLVVVGDEALQVARLLIERDGTDANLLLLYVHFVFAPDGLISQVRAFYDAAARRSPPFDRLLRQTGFRAVLRPEPTGNSWQCHRLVRRGSSGDHTGASSRRAMPTRRTRASPSKGSSRRGSTATTSSSSARSRPTPPPPPRPLTDASCDIWSDGSSSAS
jgi:hypothetical protein